MKQLSLKRKRACSLEPELEDEGRISDDSQMFEVKSSKKKPKVRYTGFGLSTWSSNVGHLPTGIKKPGLAHSHPGRLHTGLELLPHHWSPVTAISVLSPVLRPQKGNQTGPNGQECLQKGNSGQEFEIQIFMPWSGRHFISWQYHSTKGDLGFLTYIFQNFKNSLGLGWTPTDRIMDSLGALVALKPGNSTIERRPSWKMARNRTRKQHCWDPLRCELNCYLL